jgi:hypothetical protein
MCTEGARLETQEDARRERSVERSLDVNEAARLIEEEVAAEKDECRLSLCMT